jgi:hypothetical protein
MQEPPQALSCLEPPIDLDRQLGSEQGNHYGRAGSRIESLMTFKVRRVFSVDPPVPEQSHIVGELMKRLGDRSRVTEATVAASLNDHLLQRIDVELIVQADGLSEAASIARMAAKAELRKLGVPTHHLHLVDASGSEVLPS